MNTVEEGGGLHPETDDDVLEAIRWAAGEEVPLEVVGQGSKRNLGHPMQTAHTLDLSGLSGITLFEPEELVLSARAGTPLSAIVDLLDEHNQEMQFEPADLGPLLGDLPGQGTLGGLVSTNICGPRRLKSGLSLCHAQKSPVQVWLGSGCKKWRFSAAIECGDN